jgi:asparaginyl-tRNA synthetase
MDVLAPGIGEIIGGPSARNASTCSTAHRRDGLAKDDYWWYRDLRRTAPCPTPASGSASSA